jgi:hypothetical protein
MPLTTRFFFPSAVVPNPVSLFSANFASPHLSSAICLHRRWRAEARRYNVAFAGLKPSAYKTEKPKNTGLKAGHCSSA